jgi:hypothetical protein
MNATSATLTHVGPVFDVLSSGLVEYSQAHDEVFVNTMLSDLMNRLGSVESLHWWKYRLGRGEYVACEISGSKQSISLTMTLDEEGTCLPSVPQSGDLIQVQDATDAFCILRKLCSTFQLNTVAITDQGLLFGASMMHRCDKC